MLTLLLFYNLSKNTFHGTIQDTLPFPPHHSAFCLPFVVFVIIIIIICYYSRILMGSSGFSFLLPLFSCSMLLFSCVLLFGGQSSCNALSTTSCFTGPLEEFFGKVICNAHHKAVRALRVEAANSLMAAARARTSTTEEHVTG